MIARQTDEIGSGLKTLTQRILTPDHSIQFTFAAQPWMTATPIEAEFYTMRRPENAYAGSVSKRTTVLYAVDHTYAVTPKRGRLSAWIHYGAAGEGRAPIVRLPEARGEIELLQARGYVQLRIKVLDIRIGRLQAMTDVDVQREGVNSRDEYIELWKSINGARSWEHNPLVARIGFERVITYTDISPMPPPALKRIA